MRKKREYQNREIADLENYTSNQKIKQFYSKMKITREFKPKITPFKDSNSYT